MNLWLLLVNTYRVPSPTGTAKVAATNVLYSIHICKHCDAINGAEKLLPVVH